MNRRHARLQRVSSQLAWSRTHCTRMHAYSLICARAMTYMLPNVAVHDGRRASRTWFPFGRQTPRSPTPTPDGRLRMPRHGRSVKTAPSPTRASRPEVVSCGGRNICVSYAADAPPGGRRARSWCCVRAPASLQSSSGHRRSSASGADRVTRVRATLICHSCCIVHEVAHIYYDESIHIST